jgi:hypothetical protein
MNHCQLIKEEPEAGELVRIQDGFLDYGTEHDYIFIQNLL